VGSTETRSIDVHIIAATNRDLHGAVASGQFRADLYHRLRVVEICLEPLRNRKQDILPLVAFFLAAHCRRFGLSAKTLSSESMNLLTRYQWPGNVRELSHLIESTVLQVDGDVIESGDLRLTGPTTGSDIQIELPGGRTVRIDFEKGEPKLDEIEQLLLTSAFEYTGHNLSRAARILGITREALRYRLHKHSEAASHHD